MANSNLQHGEHRWKFFRAGGFDQVHLEQGPDLMALDQLDPKLWVALSCPTHGVDLDDRTLELIDTDGDGRIRVPEIIEAAKWAGSLLKDAGNLTNRSPELSLASIDDDSPEGKKLLASAKHILKNLGKEDAAVITIEDITDMEKIFAQTKFNGDGIIPPDSSDDPAIRQMIQDIIDCLGPEIDRSGKEGVSKAKVDQFFAEADAYLKWWQIAETSGTKILLLGDATVSAAEAFNSVKMKINDYFARCRLAAFDDRALSAVNRQAEEYLSFAEKNLSPDVEEVAGFPLARVGVGKPLPLREGINPAWIAPMARFVAGVVEPLLGEKTNLQESEWNVLLAKFSGYESWLSQKAGVSSERLGMEKIREIVDSRGKEGITELIAKDQMLESEFNSITSVEKLVRLHRDLFTLLNNFVSFSDFYTGKGMAIFQAGTLYMDGRSCDLCIRVDDADKHAVLATLCQTFLAYCHCTKKGGVDQMTIVAAFTSGDSDFLMVGRNGVFYDRHGQDWDATIIRIIDHPISIRQAFWSPYKRIIKLIGEQLEKLAAARAKAVSEKAASGIVSAAEKVSGAKQVVPAQPFDVAKFAGIFAAIGLAIGAIGTAIAAVVTGFLKLGWWQMPLAVLGIVLVISGFSMIIAWLKLSQRNLGPLLDANGWAINTRAKINIPFGSTLTEIASLPEGAERFMHDPYAEKKRRWPFVVMILILILLAIFLYFVYQVGILYKWTWGLLGRKP
ncbi:MAG: hypothetical protein ABSE05_16985 [Syntrophales bacterium]